MSVPEHQARRLQTWQMQRDLTEDETEEKMHG